MTRHDREGGFSLLEVMVSLAILALALVSLAGITTANVRNTHHAKMVTVATFLARSKIADVERAIIDDGFTENDQEEDGDFSDEERPEFRWSTHIERVELPADLAQQTQEAAATASEANSENPMAAMAGFMGGFMSTLVEPIRVGLEESVRRVTVKVSWDEAGRPNQSFEVVTFLTDPSKLDKAVAAIGQPPGGTDQQNPAGSGGAAGGRSSGAGGAGGPRGAAGSPGRAR